MARPVPRFGTGLDGCFPIRLGISFNQLREWECFDADTGKDSAREIREYFIPDFSQWKGHDAYQQLLRKLLDGLQGRKGSEAEGNTRLSSTLILGQCFVGAALAHIRERFIQAGTIYALHAPSPLSRNTRCIRTFNSLRRSIRKYSYFSMCQRD
jgi:hypothetical protein